MEKIWRPFFKENFENSTPPPIFYKWGDSNYEYSGAIPLQICLKMVSST